MRIEFYRVPERFCLFSANFNRAELMMKDLHNKNDLKYLHVRAVRDNAIKLAAYQGANIDIIGWSALLHDISTVKYRDSSRLHPKNSALESEIYLKKLNLPNEMISEIKHCISEHGQAGEPQSLEAKIIRAADNMADIDTFFDLVFTFCSLKSRVPGGYDRVNGLKEGHIWVGDNLAHTLSKLSEFDYAKKLIQPKLAAAQMIHASMTPHLDIRDKIFDPKTTIEAFFEVIFQSCMDEAIKDGGYDAEQGLRRGFDRADKRLFFAWFSLSKAEQTKYQALYDAEHLILGSIHQYLDK